MILKVNFKDEYLIAIRHKIIEAIKHNRKSVCIDGKLEPFAYAELVKIGYKVKYESGEQSVLLSIQEHTQIYWDYDHLNVKED